MQKKKNASSDLENTNYSFLSSPQIMAIVRNQFVLLFKSLKDDYCKYKASD